MLEPKHIIKLKIDPNRIKIHQNLPMPSHVGSKLTEKFIAINECILSSLLKIPEDKFKEQLNDARKVGVSYIYKAPSNKNIGISVATSLVKPGNLLLKNLIIPKDFIAAANDPLNDRIIISSFITGNVIGSDIDNIDDISLVGWANKIDIYYCTQQESKLPSTFKSKLKILSIPCKSLRPMNELINYLNIDTDIIKG